jgi:hypothetical protein
MCVCYSSLLLQALKRFFIGGLKYNMIIIRALYAKLLAISCLLVISGSVYAQSEFPEFVLDEQKIEHHYAQLCAEHKQVEFIRKATLVCGIGASIVSTIFIIRSLHKMHEHYKLHNLEERVSALEEKIKQLKIEPSKWQKIMAWIKNKPYRLKIDIVTEPTNKWSARFALVIKWMSKQGVMIGSGALFERVVAHFSALYSHARMSDMFDACAYKTLIDTQSVLILKEQTEKLCACIAFYAYQNYGVTFEKRALYLPYLQVVQAYEAYIQALEGEKQSRYLIDPQITGHGFVHEYAEDLKNAIPAFLTLENEPQILSNFCFNKPVV